MKVGWKICDLEGREGSIEVDGVEFENQRCSYLWMVLLFRVRNKQEACDTNEIRKHKVYAFLKLSPFTVDSHDCQVLSTSAVAAQPLGTV